jgi:acyl-CoA thioester hydrolase
VVESVFDAFKGPRMFLSQTVKRGADTLVTAKVEVCCISLTGRPRKPPALLLERLKPFLGS